MLHLRELRVLCCVVCLERQRGCGKIGSLLRPLFPPLDATCPARTWWALRGHVTPKSQVIRLNSRSVLELKNCRNPHKHVEGDKRTGTTRQNACNRETMVKIRLAIIFIIAQVVLTKHTSRRCRHRTVEDRAIRCNRNIEANCLSNNFTKLQTTIASASHAQATMFLVILKH